MNALLILALIIGNALVATKVGNDNPYKPLYVTVLSCGILFAAM